jgi:hypothetical protein
MNNTMNFYASFYFLLRSIAKCDHVSPRLSKNIRYIREFVQFQLLPKYLLQIIFCITEAYLLHYLTFF